jgi:hypothetical protein
MGGLDPIDEDKLASDETEGPVWDAIRKGETPDQIVLDPETRLEGFLGALGCLPIMVGIGGLFILFEDNTEPGVAYAVGGLFLLGIIAFILRFNLDDHYILDFSKKEILFHRKFFAYKKKRRVCDFSELCALVVLPEKNSNKQSSWWEYGLLAVTHTGKKITVVSSERIDYDVVVTHGREVAELMNTTFHAGEPQKHLHVKRGPGGPEFEYQNAANLRTLAIGFAMLLLILLGFVTALRIN